METTVETEQETRYHLHLSFNESEAANLMMWLQDKVAGDSSHGGELAAVIHWCLQEKMYS